jgi:hypothetical protein
MSMASPRLPNLPREECGVAGLQMREKKIRGSVKSVGEEESEFVVFSRAFYTPSSFLKLLMD